MPSNQKPYPQLTDFLPTTKKECELRGWTQLDVILFSGDAYVDHPAFGAAAVGRIIEAAGYKVAIVPQPDWHGDFRDFKKLGRPRLFFAISPGNMDSMVNRYTANRRMRHDDAYSPDSRHDMRPDYPSIVYTKILKQLFPDVPVVLGGIDFYPKRKVKTITDVTRRFYRNWDETKYRHYLELFGIDESKRVDQLSSGMKVKYLLALALSHNAKLLILDEPTSGLDPVSRDELVELFRAIVADGQRSILFSTHITSDLEKCASHIAFIKDGEMLYDGGVEDFKARFRDKGETMEDIIVAVERRELDDSAII